MWRKRAKRNYLQLCDIIFHNSISQTKKIIAKESPKNIVDTAENNCFILCSMLAQNLARRRRRKKAPQVGFDEKSEKLIILSFFFIIFGITLNLLSRIKTSYNECV